VDDIMFSHIVCKIL